jgi:hypothetical protein
MERGNDFFGEDFGGPEDLDTEDIPRIAKLDGDTLRDFKRSGDLALVSDQVEHVGLAVILDLGFYNHL